MNYVNKMLLVIIAVCCVRTGQVRAVTAEETDKITKAMPARSVVTPKQPRKLLVFSLCGEKGFKHSCIPYWEKALEIMGAKTGAFSVTCSTDMEVFSPGRLKEFDAVCFNNTTQLKFTDSQRQTLMDFIKGGKGIVGIHAATDNFYDWPEAAEMMGGQFSGHPWLSNGNWAVKIDDPGHPLMKSFEGKGFKINDEIYRTREPLYSRNKQRVLMSLDMSDQATANAKGVEPKDKDTGLSWIKNYGKGRLFYCSLGHNHHITWNPAILYHYLAGIQFALGDLQVDAAPVPLAAAE